MKNIFSFLAHGIGRLALMLCLCAFSSSANAQEVDTIPHLPFMGVPIAGTITEFTRNMQPRYKLQKKVGNDQYYIYRGPVFGHEMYLKADYSRKTRTVYKVTVTPQFIDTNALLDSLRNNFGEPNIVAKGYQWSTVPGEIYFYTPQGYDPILVYIDRQGTLRFRDER